MARAVLPRISARDEWLLTGFAGGTPDGEHKAAPLDDEPGPEEEHSEPQEVEVPSDSSDVELATASSEGAVDMDTGM